MEILNFLLNSANIERLKAGLQYINILGPDELKPAQRTSLSDEIGAQILGIVAVATAERREPIVLNLEFANDSFCEWAYVISLDEEKFEVYTGAKSKNQAASRRFNNIGGEHDTVPVLVSSFSFTRLPKTEEFVRLCRGPSGEAGFVEAF
jgi:hypothetical protein